MKMENTSWVFSPSEAKFYFTGLHDLYEKNDNWPADAVAVTADVRTQFNTPPEGKVLGAADGMPVWVDVPPPTAEQLIAQAEQQKTALRQSADAEIAWRQDAVDAGIATAEETAALADWKKYRVLLMRINTATPDIEWPSPPDARGS